MRRTSGLAVWVAVTAALAMGQSSSRIQSWSGLLVAASCESSGTAGIPRSTTASAREQNTTYEQTQNEAARPKKTASSEAMPRTTDRGTPVVQKDDDPLARTTTPPIDEKNTRGKATINNTGESDAANRVAGNSAAGSAENDVDAIRGMSAGCRVAQNTKAFALRMTDGSVVKFDDASNTKIAQQLQSGDRLQHKTKIFRVKVKGSLHAGAIAADTVQI